LASAEEERSNSCSGGADSIELAQQALRLQAHGLFHRTGLAHVLAAEMPVQRAGLGASTALASSDP
jgi:hypothetical protein